jgi:magnesium transporter
MRSPWLLINLALALGVALVIEQQTGIISRIPILAALMPVVALLGGNAGTQSLAVVIRSLAADDVPVSRIVGILGRQLRIGLLVGGFLAASAAVTTYLLVQAEVFTAAGTGELRVALVVGIAVMANLTIATTVGAAIPLLLRRLGLDPALAASIFLTFITDVVGFGGFLVVAGFLL